MDVRCGVRRHGGLRSKIIRGRIAHAQPESAFDFICIDRSGNGIDPFTRQDFSGGRCNIYMLEAADMEQIRGAAVQF